MPETDVIHGFSVAKALVLLDQADVALIRVPTVAGEFTLLGVDPKAIRSAIASHAMSAPMPTKLYRDGAMRKIEIGSPEAVAAYAQQEAAQSAE